MKKTIVLASVFYFSCCLHVLAQYSFTTIVKDASGNQPLVGVIIKEAGGQGAVTNDSGIAVIDHLAAGSHSFTCSFLGYLSDNFTITIPATASHVVFLHADNKTLDEVTIVASTRTNETIENAPIKVEILGREEMDEENTIKPGNIASIISDVSGIQIQQSSATTGNSNVRIQGLGGQYTQFLRDGMPLFDGLSGGFGILQIPPLDLMQIELIKGSASTLYGGGAIGGLINLISKRPANKQEAIFTVNTTTLRENNINAYLAKKYKKIGYTFFAGYTHQQAIDVNNDGFSDIPQTRSFMIHPRVFFYPDDKTTITLGYNGTFEERFGGSMRAINNDDTAHQYYEKDKMQRHTGEFIFERVLPSSKKLTVKSSLSSFTRDITASSGNVTPNQVNYYAEASLFIPVKANSWVIGVNTVGLGFQKAAADTIPLRDFTNNTIGAFVQYYKHIHDNTTIELGLRGDHDFNYGDFILPCVAIFHRFSTSWAGRAGVGLGYRTPNPLAPQDIDYALADIQPLASGVGAEHSVGYNIEANYKKEWADKTSLFINHAFFLTQVSNPVVAMQLNDDRVVFNNQADPIVTAGFDTYIKLTIHDVELYIGYTYVDAERTYLPHNSFVPLTPRNRAAFTAVYEIEGKWRLGLEGSYIGTQYRYDASTTPVYYLAAAMVERKLGKKCSVVLNCENIFDYKMSTYESLYTGSTFNPVFKPLWAPIDGRVLNLSVKITPFEK